MREDALGVRQRDVIGDQLRAEDVFHACGDGVHPGQEGHLVDHLPQGGGVAGDVQKHIGLQQESEGRPKHKREGRSMGSGRGGAQGTGQEEGDELRVAGKGGQDTAFRATSHVLSMGIIPKHIQQVCCWMQIGTNAA